MRKSILKGGAVLTVGECMAYSCSFIRNIILARLLTKTDFGVAASFAMMISFLDLTSKLGINIAVVQSAEGKDPEFLSTAHFVQAISGMLSGVAMFLLAGPIAMLFGIPEARKFFACLGIIPLMAGFQNLDVEKMKREMRFIPAMVTYVLPQLATTILAAPVVYWLQDYRSLLILLATRWFMVLVLTHMLARTSYRWSLKPVFLRQVVLFAWPLLANGFLLVLIHQGDQLLVGSGYSMAVLGGYYAVFALAVTPTMVLTNVFNNLFLPYLALEKSNTSAFRDKYILCTQVIASLAVLFSTTSIIIGEPLLVLLYGPKYSGLGPLFGWLMASQAMRFMRNAPNIGAIAKGDTKNPLFSNLARSVGILLSITVVSQGFEVYMVGVAAFIAELFAVAVSASYFARKQGVRSSETLRPTFFVASTMALASIVSRNVILNSGDNWVFLLAITLLTLAISCVLNLCLFARVRQEVTSRRYSASIRALFSQV